MQRIVLYALVAAASAAIVPAAHAALFVSIRGVMAAPGATVSIPVEVTSTDGTSPLVNTYAVAITTTDGTFGASTDTSAANVPQFLGTTNFSDIGDTGDPAVGRTASVVNNLSDAATGESVNFGQFKGLFLATFTVPTTARPGDLISLSVDPVFTSFSSPTDSTGNSTLLAYDAAGTTVVVTPEPATLGVIGGAAALLLRRRRC